MKNLLFISILSIGFMASAILASDNFKDTKKFKQKICMSISSIPTFSTLGQLLKSGFDLPTAVGASLFVGGGSYFVCKALSQEVNIPEEDRELKIKSFREKK